MSHNGAFQQIDSEQQHHADRPRLPNAARPIRMVASDLDGTLLQPDGSVSPRTQAALQRVREAGIVVVLVSARPPRVLHQIALAAGIGGLALCCNGGLLYDLEQDCILHSTTMLPMQTQWLIETLRAALPELHFAVETGLEVTCEPGYHRNFTEHAEKWKLRLADTASCYRAPVVKLMALHHIHTPDELHAHVSSLVGTAYSVTYSGGAFLEIALASVTKASALARLCAEQGIDAREVIAFGDMPNDLSMLRWAGHSVAVANAHPLVLEAVHEVTHSNADDGIALVLERLMSSQ